VKPKRIESDINIVREFEDKAKRLEKIERLYQSEHRDTVLMLLDEQKDQAVKDLTSRPVDVVSTGSVIALPYSIRGKLQAIEAVRMNFIGAGKPLTEIRDALKNMKEEM
jgi:hypothetical protein